MLSRSQRDAVPKASSSAWTCLELASCRMERVKTTSSVSWCDGVDSEYRDLLEFYTTRLQHATQHVEVRTTEDQLCGLALAVALDDL